MKRYFIAAVLSAYLLMNLSGTPVKNVAHGQSVLETSATEKTEASAAPRPETATDTPITAVAPPMTHEQMMEQAGIDQNDSAAADYIISHESGWCALKWQRQIGYCPTSYVEYYPGAVYDAYEGYGLCQSTPAIKMAAAGDDWQTNPITQLRWCASHATAAYGGWQGAYAHWLSYHWW